MMNSMDTKSCSKFIENSSEAVIVEGQTSDSISQEVLIENVKKPQQRKENDSTMAKDIVSSSSNISAHEEVADNVTAVSCNKTETDTSKAKAKEFHLETESDTSKAKEFHIVDLSSGGGERICRICHFGSDQSSPGNDDKSITPELIEIGCKCKNELGLAHFHCAEAWFKLRGNGVCEICGCTAKNVTVRLMEEWNSERDNTLDGRQRRGRGQSCCIFMVFILIIILLHWFFKKITGYYQNP